MLEVWTWMTENIAILNIASLVVFIFAFFGIALVSIDKRLKNQLNKRIDE